MIVITASMVIFFIIAIYFGYQEWGPDFRSWWRYRKWQNSPKIKQAQIVYDALFNDICGFQLSLEERERLNKANLTLTYGEINFISFAMMLHNAGMQSGDVFYDLGSGIGKAVFAAALLYDLKKAVGIEVLDALYKNSKQLIAKLDNLPERKQHLANRHFAIEMVQEDFLNVDISDADVVFINATCYFGDYWDNIVAKFNELKPGTKVITSSRRLNSDVFELLESNIYPMSWGECSVNIHQKR